MKEIIASAENSVIKNSPLFKIEPNYLGYFKNINFINQIQLPDLPIYQTLNINHLKAILQNGRLRFGNIYKSWQDVYELFYLKNNFQVAAYGGVKMSVDDIKLSYYGQCWSYNEDSDAMWRIYSNKMDGVRIKTSISKIYNQILRSYLPGPYLSIPSIGNVRYLSNTGLQKWQKMHKAQPFINTIDAIQESIFIKRNPFKHENEIRVIFSTECSPQNILLLQQLHASTDDAIYLPINIEDFIEEIALDPRLNDSQFLSKKKSLLKILNGKNIPIVQSPLYKYKSAKINII